ncbi:hypothetical protein P7C73_g5579, partial [Tremellales sp. Uapishka_1]
MPRPIANLPTMAGWAGLKESGGSGTPGWGAVASPGPKTPGWGGLGTPGPRTPGWNGFPFSTPPPNTNGKGKEKEVKTEEEMRKARRAMPVMLREPSTVGTAHHDGGDAGDDDEDEDGESETEMEGGSGDSEDETETEPTQSPTNAMAIMKSRLKGKGRKHTMSAAAEPPASMDAHSPPRPAPLPLADRREASSQLGNLTIPTEPVTTKKSVWSLSTPTQREVSAAPTSWMTFGASTPAATPMKTPRAVPAHSRANSVAMSTISSSGSDSYFDSQVTSSAGSNATNTPRVERAEEPVLMRGTGQELARSDMGLGAAVTASPVSSLARTSDDGDATDEGSGGGSTPSSMDHQSPALPSLLPPEASAESSSSRPAMPPTEPSSSSRPAVAKRPSLYTQASQSMVNLSSPRPVTPERPPRREEGSSAQAGREVIPSRIEIPPTASHGVLSPNSEWARPPPTPAAGSGPSFWGKEEKPAVKRRRSADDLMQQPPKYEPPFPGTVIPQRRDEEGKEKLPAYWCAVHIEGSLQRKMEFAAPGVQSKDRSWKRNYFLLTGTTLFVYKLDPHKFPLKMECPVPGVTEVEVQENLHVHLPGERRASLNMPVSTAPAPRRASVTNASGPPGRRGSVEPPAASANEHDVKDPALFPTQIAGSRRPSISSSTSGPTSSSASSASASGLGTHLGFHNNALVKQYTLQNAESGLAADYVKRKNVVRVRAEGEQFLLQTENAKDVVDWIEAFQAATNVALDLDDRPMPKIITLPRRRRRRVAGSAAAGPPTAAASAAVASEAAATDRERMLAEDQAAGV